MYREYIRIQEQQNTRKTITTNRWSPFSIPTTCFFWDNYSFEINFELDFMYGPVHIGWPICTRLPSKPHKHEVVISQDSRVSHFKHHLLEPRQLQYYVIYRLLWKKIANSDSANKFVIFYIMSTSLYSCSFLFHKTSKFLTLNICLLKLREL